MSQIVELKVAMSCQGCAGAVRRVLDKMEGVESYDINLEEQKVTVKGNVKPDEVLQTVSKSGKKTAFWQETPAEPEAKHPEAAPGDTEAKPADATPANAEAKPADAMPANAESKPTEAVPAETESKAAEAAGTVAAA